jgi:hypothetical protein
MSNTQVVVTHSAKELALIDAELAAEAAEIAESIGKPSSNIINIQDKVFKLPDGQILQEPLDVIIIDHISKNFFYEGAWDPKNPEGPVCWAINRKLSDLAPAASAPLPQTKGDCEKCPMNEWGSDGDGKACKNTRALAVLLPNIGDGKQLYTLNVSPTAIKSFDGYVNGVLKLFKAPPIKVLTEITFHPDKRWAYPVFGDPRPNEHYAEHMARRPEARAMLEVEPKAGEPKDAAKPKARGRK